MNGHTAVLLVLHGSRRQEADDLPARLREAARQVAGVAHAAIAYCGLQAPDIAAGIAGCVAAGADRVLLYPCLLRAGSHVRDDLPAALARAEAEHPGVEFRLLPPLGADPGLAGLVAASLSRGLAAADRSPRRPERPGGRKSP